MVVDKKLLEAMETIVFTLPNPMDPMTVMNDVKSYLHAPDSVIYLECYIQNIYLITVCGDDAVSRLRYDGKVFVGGKLYDYEVPDKTVKRVIIHRVKKNLTQDDIDKFFEQFGKVINSEMEKNRRAVCTYFCLIMEKVDTSIPQKVTISGDEYDVVSF